MVAVAEMLPALDNFVSYGAEVVKSRQDYKQMLLDIYTTAMASEQLGENDRCNGSKLAESMMLNLRGDIDEVYMIHSPVCVRGSFFCRFFLL
jgi:importin-7